MTSNDNRTGECKLVGYCKDCLVWVEETRGPCPMMDCSNWVRKRRFIICSICQQSYITKDIFDTHPTRPSSHLLTTNHP